MEGCCSLKLQKINKDLSKLNIEINTGVNFLRYLQQYSQEAVAKLNPSSSKNIEDFSLVHSFLKKYLDVLEDVNWKFQVVEVESGTDNFKFFSKLSGKEIKIEEEKITNYKEVIYEPPQKPFENIIHKPLEKSLIDLSFTSSDGELEEKEINLVKTPSPKKLNSEYKGLPLPIPPTTTYKDDDLLKSMNNLKMENKEIYNKDFAVCEKKDLNKKENVEYYDDVPSMNISREPLTQYQGHVEHVISPGQFYVHFFVKEIRDIEVLKDVLASRSSSYHRKQVYQDLSISETDRKKIAIECIGDYGIWFDSCEKEWFRVKITDWRLEYDDDLVSVHLIDFGESNCVSLSVLQPLDSDLHKYPAFAVKCHLAGVYPCESKSGLPITKWGKEPTDMFNILLESSVLCKIIIAEHDGCYLPDSIPIQLFATDSDKTINDTLVEFEFAKYLTSPPATLPCIKTLPKKKTAPPISENKSNIARVLTDWDPMKEDYESHRNTYDLDVDDPASAIYGYVGKDYEKICYRFGTTGSCYKGDSCRKEHKLFDPDGFTIDEETIYIKAFNQLQPPAVGEEFKVAITCINNVNLFYCQREEEEECSVKGKPAEETLITLNEYINKKQNFLNFKKLAVPPAKGQIVLGLFEDGYWYRARVMYCVPEADLYQLFFVDYGNSSAVSLEKIRKIEPKFLHLPFQAIRCQLYGVEPSQVVSKKEAVRYFKSFVEEKSVIAKVVHVSKAEGADLMVKLYDMDFKDIGEDLIAKKLAIRSSPICVHESNEFFPG